MNSKDQPSFRLKTILPQDYVFPIGSVILVAIAFWNRDHSHFNSGAFLGLGCAGLRLFSLLSRIKLKVWELCAVLTVVILFGVAFITKGNNPQLSSISFISALSLMLGAVSIISLARFQVFFYGKNQGLGIFYIDGGYPTGGDSPLDHGKWSGFDSWGGDCGGDGGGGDCGG